MSLPTVTVVIPHFFPAREAHLRPILDAHAYSSAPPEEILIWNNEAAPLAVNGWNQRVTIINAGKNFGAKARLLAALMATSDYVLFQDNDLKVQPDTVANLLLWAGRCPATILTLDGVAQTRGDYRHWPKRKGTHVLTPLPVDIALGRIDLVPRRAIPTILDRFPFEPSTYHDDLWFSWAARKVGYVIAVVPSVAGVNDFTEFPHRNIGSAVGPDRADHWAARDRLAAELFG